ncbi:MAG: hypothetical protein EHM70_16735, partial [Chloroflexota bacterium]
GDTEYTVTIGTEAINALGETVLAEPYSWKFRTYYYYSYYSPLSFGEYGANAQVVDANGRRAIQFANNDLSATVSFKLYEMELGEFVKRYAEDFKVKSYSSTGAGINTEGLESIKTWSIYVETSLQELILPEDVPTGLYILDMSSGDILYDQLFVILSRSTLMVKRSGDELLVWATDINGGSLAEYEVRIYSERGEKIREGYTDENGLYRTTVPEGYEALLAAGRGEEGDVTIAGFEWAWASDNNPYWWWSDSDAGGNHAYTTYIYTDRPIYKPGQTVYFKTILREDEDVRYSVPPEGTPVTVTIHDARDNVVQSFGLATNDMGTVNGEFNLAGGAMLGNYEIEVVAGEETQRETIKVQDYRKPDFEVKLSSNGDRFVVGDEVVLDIDVSYFFGEPVPGASLDVKLYQLQPVYSWWWDEQQDQATEYYWILYNDSDRGKTDALGHDSYGMIATQVDDWYVRESWTDSLKEGTWGIEITADDGSHQTVSSALVFKVYSASEKISLDTGGYYKRPGESFTIEATVSTLDEAPVSGRQLQLELREWDRETWDYSTILASSTLQTGDDGIARVPFTIPKAGYYQLRLSGKDGRGYGIDYNRWIYAFDDPGNWVSRDAFSISAERDQYRPYETARFLIESTFSGPALLTFERGRVNRAKPVHLTAPLTLVEVDIIPEDAPNIYVTVNAWQAQDTRLPDEDYYWGSNMPDSDLRTTSVEVQVENTEKALAVTITPDQESYAPRQEATFTIQVADESGQPVEAEVSLAMVDEAIFSLSDELAGPIFQAFYGRRPATVITYDSMSPYREIYAGGRGGGGGGDGALSSSGPRSDFPDTAAWFPSLKTDASGKVSVTLVLPDSLTSWRLTAKAVSSRTQVGEAVTNITTHQEILVRPALPRNLTAGDLVDLSARIHNYTQEFQEIDVSLQSELLALQSEAVQTIQLDPGDVGEVYWTVIALAAGEADVTVSAAPRRDGVSGDAVQLPLSVAPLAVPDLYHLAGDFEGSFETTLTLPPNALPSSVVEIELSRSIAGSIFNGLDYLTGYPYGCVEQTMSRALPNAVVGRALTQIGVVDPGLKAQLPDMINSGLQRLYGMQHDDGGWGWWFDDNTDAYQTAWVVFGLSVTAEAGYPVDSGVIEAGVTWLKDNLESMEDIRTRTYALYSMAYAGYGDVEEARLLADQVYELDTFSQAALALTLQRLGEETLARQKALGVVPADTKLAAKPEAIKDWNKLSADEKKLFARQMEVFAGFGEYTDTEIGRLVKA